VTRVLSLISAPLSSYVHLDNDKVSAYIAKLNMPSLIFLHLATFSYPKDKQILTYFVHLDSSPKELASKRYLQQPLSSISMGPWSTVVLLLHHRPEIFTSRLWLSMVRVASPSLLSSIPPICSWCDLFGYDSRSISKNVILNKPVNEDSLWESIFLVALYLWHFFKCG
jgi:hypothetical protein